MNQSQQSPTRLTSQMRGTFVTVGIFSAVINVLMLASPLYMMQVFDRVVASRSWETLIYLTAIALGALAVMAAIDTLRSRLMTRVGEWLERKAGNDAFHQAVLRMPGGRARRSGDEALRDIARVRGFLTSPVALAIFDVPWMPLYFVLTFLLHPLLGWAAVVGGIVLMGVAILGDISTRRPTSVAGEANERAMRIMAGAQRNAEALQAMGLAASVASRWANAMDGAHTASRSASDRMAILSGMSKFLRFGLQIAILGIGAWLVVEQQLTGGASIAASIIISRALGPIDHAIGSWRQIVASHQAWQRLKAFLAVSGPARRTALPPLRGALACEHVTYCLPGIERPLLRDVSFAVPAGRSLAIVGPSGSGKSTLARLMVGVLAPTAGTVRLDGADAFAMPREEAGPQIGYLPQDVELFGGTVAENIARMEEPDDSLVVTAARRARVHDMILRMPAGYESEVGDDGSRLSGGQRQRVGLARALYGEPRFLVLDEPNANLDIEGEEALVEALREQQPRGATVVMVTHRLNLVALADYVLLLREGAVEMFGPRDEVLARLRGPRPAPAPAEQIAQNRARGVAVAGGAA
ncbi:MAG: type I secretion system permease/ATPase [Alphaproteobacteria bacterium]|nr:type I secretion system permease/ATPase [Alphaproteobacteria bacterium]